MTTKLLKFKVRNFRSIEESSWIDLNDNSCLIGTNEAGKTNLLIALWKLKPANDEPIIPLSDFPRNLYSQYKKENHNKDFFIEAVFLLGDGIQKEISEKLLCDIELVKQTLVKRNYDGDYSVSFPYTKIDTFPKERILGLITSFKRDLLEEELFNKEPELLKKQTLEAIDFSTYEPENNFFTKVELESLFSSIKTFSVEAFGRKQNLPEFFEKNLFTPLSKILDAFDGKPLIPNEEVKNVILQAIPNFIYYSDYGNLDSEIYLPRVIEDIERTDLTESARAKVRTLEVLFKYVGLSPKEIYELGNDRRVLVKELDSNKNVLREREENPSAEEIETWAEKKKERAVLLKSASSSLTQNFKKWWLQGDYIFSFEADGNHFRINVSDELRPEPIELEGRSRGLQWFFSFFLVFLVETKGEHSNSVLLLDEPGLSLHPLAQFDLSKFFKSLSKENQLVYTSHSPFLVDMDNLANVKAVYVDKETGRTNVSSDLRHNQQDSEKSIYPVHAALGLSVSETLLLGCKPILVEGISDQIYLTCIKRYLMGKGKINSNQELVFIPVGGVKGMSPIIKLVSSRENDLPTVLLDSDSSGKLYKSNLINGKYKEHSKKVFEVDEFLGENKSWEIEDLIPHAIITQIIDRKYRGATYFSDNHDYKEPIVDQIESWAEDNKINLEKGWKVEVSKEIINRSDKFFNNISSETEEVWDKLFKVFTEQ